MGRQEDIEKHIENSYGLIAEYEDILRTSSDPKEKARAERTINEQRELIRQWSDEYKQITGQPFTYPRTTSDAPTDPPVASHEQALPGEDAHQESKPEPYSIAQLWAIPKHYLWGQILLLLLFLMGTVEGVVGVFDIPPCPRRLSLAILTAGGGSVILGLSLTRRFQSHYQTWDRRLALGLLVIGTGLFAGLAYSGCRYTNQCPVVTLSASPEQVPSGERVRLTADADDRENDALDYAWESTFPGLRNEGGPYNSPLNEYVAPPESAGQAVRFTVLVDDHSCGKKIGASKTIHVVLPAGTLAAEKTQNVNGAETPAPFSGSTDEPFQIQYIVFDPPSPASRQRIKVFACTSGFGGVGISLKVSVNSAPDGTSTGQWLVLKELGVPCFNQIDAPVWDAQQWEAGTYLVKAEAKGPDDPHWEHPAVLTTTYTLLESEVRP